jgi:hypothetical protein
MIFADSMILHILLREYLLLYVTAELGVLNFQNQYAGHPGVDSSNPDREYIVHLVNMYSYSLSFTAFLEINFLRPSKGQTPKNIVMYNVHGAVFLTRIRSAPEFRFVF